jgi:uncharacterized protein YbjT (DUF2867 family)
MTATKKTIAVVGATGAQGGGLVRAILQDNESGFRVRALTRTPGNEKARNLAELGAEVVSADLDDVESLNRAFDGVQAAYCVTNFWEHMSPEKELLQARNMADAARDAGVEHVIWSTLEDTRTRVPLSDNRMPTLMSKYKVPHFDAKGEANAEFESRGVPTTYLLTSFYWDNFIHFGMEPQRGADGVLMFAMPMADRLLPGIAAEDIGKCAYGIFKRGSEFIDKTVGIAGEHLTGKQMATVFSRVLGEQVVYQDIDPETYRALGFPGADDLGNMFQFKRDFNDEFCRARSIELSRSLNPELLTFDAWLAKNKERMPIGKVAT